MVKMMKLLLCLLSLTRTIAFLTCQSSESTLSTALSSSVKDAIHRSTFTCKIEGKTVTTKRWFRREAQQLTDLEFDYEANRLVLGDASQKRSRAILFIHPIGVGISRWYYDRLLSELYESSNQQEPALVFVPDLLACGSASQPKGESRNVLPLFGVIDWSSQLLQLMDQVEQQEKEPIDWCIVSNGGCVSIALETGARYLEKTTATGNLTNMILSATPRLPSLLREPPPAEKVAKSYRFLSGLPGKFFWWYSLRKNGKFIRKFSERSLVADPANLGEDWTPQCVATAKVQNSKFSTFAFLAGALQHDCRAAFATLGEKRVQIDVISSPSKKAEKPSARSWFWERKRKLKPKTEDEERLSQFLERNGNGGGEIFVGGRTCLAHEDAEGYAKALQIFIER